MLWSVYLLNMKQGVLLSCWSVWYLRKSSQASLTAVSASMTQMGMRATSGWNAFTTGTKFKMARPTKYTLAMRWKTARISSWGWKTTVCICWFWWRCPHTGGSAAHVSSDLRRVSWRPLSWRVCQRLGASSSRAEEGSGGFSRSWRLS